MPLDLEKKRARDRKYAEEHREQRRLANKAYRAIPANRDRELARKVGYNKTRKLFRYGLNKAKYDTMLQEQNGVCAICKATSFGIEGRRWAIDHDHKTSKVRGLLCHSCNAGIGLLKDSPEILKAAAEYLEKARKATAG